jgi:hypothetical protein
MLLFRELYDLFPLLCMSIFVTLPPGISPIAIKIIKIKKIKKLKDSFLREKFKFDFF